MGRACSRDALVRTRCGLERADKIHVQRGRKAVTSSTSRSGVNERMSQSRSTDNPTTSNIRALGDLIPVLGPGAYVDPAAVLIGDVEIGANASIWPGVVVRGDVHKVRIGAETNIQDGAICHCTSPHGDHPGFPLLVGARVTVGHGAVLHACTIEDEVMIGMRATVMDGAVVESGAFVGAGSLVPPGKHVQGGYLWLGIPARRVRPLDAAEQAQIAESAAHYLRVKARYQGA